MVDSDQGGGSSPPLPTARQKKQWRAKLRRLDRRCTHAQRLMAFQGWIGRIDAVAVAASIYQKADMERMLIRRLIKSYRKENP